jgi:hypothetical protein
VIDRRAIVRLIHLWSLAFAAVALTTIALALPVSGATGSVVRSRGDQPIVHRAGWPAWSHPTTSIYRSTDPPKSAPGAMAAGSPTKQSPTGSAVHEFSTLSTPPALERTIVRTVPRRLYSDASVGVLKPPPRFA